jgi:integrase
MGGRKGHKQSCTFAERKLADAANALCRSRRHKVTDEEVYRAIHGISDDEARGIPTLSEWATDWIARRRELGEVEPDYLDRIESVAMRRIIPRLGKLRMTNEQITTEIVTDWVTWLRSQPGPTGTLKPTTIREAHTFLHSLLQAAVPKYLHSNPAAAKVVGGRRKSGLPKAEHYEPVFLTPDEIKLIVAACPPAIRDMVEFSLLTGLRLGELLALRVEDVELAGKHPVVRVRRALKKDGRIGQPKSRRSRRSQRVSKRCVAILQPRVTGKPRHALVFPAPEGGMWNPSNLRQRYWLPAVAQAQRCTVHPPPLPPKPARGPRRQWRPDEVSDCLCETRLQRDVRWHDLRHTAVSIRVEEGWDIIRVSRWIGHESVSITADIYGHLWEPEGDDRVDELDRYLLLAEDQDLTA